MPTADLPAIVPIGAADVERTEGKIDFPFIAYAGVIEKPDGTLAMRGMGGLFWRFDRCWIWFRRFDGEGTYGVMLVRQARRMLRRAVQLGHSEVYCWRDDSLESSKRLLEVIGFRHVGNERLVLNDGSDGGEMELWRHSVSAPAP